MAQKKRGKHRGAGYTKALESACSLWHGRPEQARKDDLSIDVVVTLGMAIRIIFLIFSCR